jgi:hypothetical protein
VSVPAWYFDWAREHCTAFGFREQQAETVAAWGPVFARLFRPEELHEATGLMLANPDAPKFAADHRGAILRAVEAVRRRATARATESSAPRGCIECDGSGIVVVPHPGLTEDGSRWRQVLLMPNADPRGLSRTVGVCCVLCSAGAKTREATEQQGRPLMTISQYEHLYPSWRDVQRARREVLDAAREPPTAEDVAKLNRLLADIRQREQRRTA